MQNRHINRRTLMISGLPEASQNIREMAMDEPGLDDQSLAVWTTGDAGLQEFHSTHDDVRMAGRCASRGERYH